jgi:glucokinase
VESWLGSRGFARVARERAALEPDSALARAIADGEEPDSRVLSALARDGCSAAVAALAECGRWLGIACANVVAVLQPERILVAGGSMRAGKLLLDPALGEYEARCMDAARGTVPVVVAELGVQSAAIGAALLARANLDADRAGTR